MEISYEQLANTKFSINSISGSSSNGNDNEVNVDENGIGNGNEDNNKEDKSQDSFVVLPEEVGQDELLHNIPTDQVN